MPVLLYPFKKTPALSILTRSVLFPFQAITDVLCLQFIPHMDVLCIAEVKAPTFKAKGVDVCSVNLYIGTFSTEETISTLNFVKLSLIISMVLLGGSHLDIFKVTNPLVVFYIAGVKLITDGHCYPENSNTGSVS